MNLNEIKLSHENINLKEVLVYLDYRGSVIPDETMSEIQELIDVICNISKPRYFIEKFNIEFGSEGIHVLGTNLVLKGNEIRKHLKNCREIYLMCATIGVEADKYIRRLQITDMSKAIIADSISSTAIEAVCNILCHRLENKLSENGLFLTDRFSPGYGDMPISQQKELLSVLNSNRTVGINLSSSGLMIPKKSVSAVMGVSDVKPEKRENGCESCMNFMDCKYRKVGDYCGKIKSM